MRLAPKSRSGFLAITLAMLAGLTVTAATPARAVAAATAGSAGNGLARYYHQWLTWQPCPGSADATILCAAVKVPLSYASPAGRSITVMIDRLPAGTPGRHPILLTNPGGPGGQGLPTPGQLRGELPASVLDAFDIIGFDPRFIGRSTPVSCGQPAEDLGGIWMRWPHPGSFPGDVAAARDRARACAAASGWALPYATTANTARDMDIIRGALGAPRMSFLGFSYGGYLGAVYTALFPRRTARFVLDSPVDPSHVWYGFGLERAATLEAALAAFSAWLAGNDAAFHFGATAQAARQAWDALVAAADATPVKTPDGLTWTGDLIKALTWILLYNDHDYFVLASDLAALAAGQSVPFPPPPPITEPAGIPPDNNTAAYLAITCGDAPAPRDPAFYRQMVAVESAKLPFLGGEQANITPCAFWPFQPGPPASLAGDHARGVLIVDSDGDPATPYAGSQLIHADIPGSRLISLHASVHVPYPGYGDACVNDAVSGYLATGQLPAADLQCA
jgi:pimeloyl-ACP methyl ester carboxylesterase